MERKWKIAIGILTLVLISLIGCGSKKSHINIGISVCENRTSRSVAMIRNLQDCIEKDNRSFTLRSASSSLEQQKKDLQDLIDMKPEYMVVMPVKTFGLESVLDEATEAGITVIILDRNMEESLYQDYLVQISADAYEEGKLCAKLLGDYFDGQAAKILEVQGSRGSSESNDRARGFRDQLCDYDNIDIIDVLYGDSDRVEASHAVKEYLDEGKTMDAVFGHSDEDGLGAMSAVFDFDENRKVPIVSVNGQQEVKEAVMADRYLGTVYSSPLLGELLVQAIHDYEAGKEVEKKISIPVEAYLKPTISNMQEY